MARELGPGTRPVASSHLGGELDEWMNRYGDSVLRFARSRVGDRHEAEDVFQEVFLRAYRARKSLRDPARTEAWLLRIAANVCTSRFRLMRRRRDEGSDLPDAPDAAPGPETLALREAAEAELLRQVTALPQALRDVVILFYFEELSVRDVAIALHCSDRAVRTRLHRARRHLRRALERGGAGDGE